MTASGIIDRVRLGPSEYRSIISVLKKRKDSNVNFATIVGAVEDTWTDTWWFILGWNHSNANGVTIDRIKNKIRKTMKNFIANIALQMTVNTLWSISWKFFVTKRVSKSVDDKICSGGAWITMFLLRRARQLRKLSHWVEALNLRGLYPIRKRNE